MAGCRTNIMTMFKSLLIRSRRRSPQKMSMAVPVLNLWQIMQVTEQQVRASRAGRRMRNSEITAASLEAS